MINISKAYIKNGKILMDGKQECGTVVHQVISIPFEEDESRQMFTITGTMEFLNDLIRLTNKSLKK